MIHVDVWVSTPKLIKLQCQATGILAFWGQFYGNDDYPGMGHIIAGYCNSFIFVTKHVGMTHINA